MVSGKASGGFFSNGYDAQPGEGALDLRALGQAVAARKFWIVVPTLVVLAVSIVAVNVITPRYTGEARILLEARDGYYTRPDGDKEQPGAQVIDPEAVQSQVQVIMSRDLARDAIRKLGLVGNGEFDPGVGVLNALKRMLVILGFSSHPADRSPEDRVLEKYYDRLTVYPVARSRIVAVEFTSQDPAVASKGANIIAETYLATQEQAKKDTARLASSWLGGAIEPLRRKVAESEAKVEEYRARAGLQTGPNNLLVTSQQLADISTQLASARSAQADSQAKAKLLKEALRTGRLFEVPDVANNELVRRLIEQRVTLKTQLALESRTLLAEHPRIKELSAQLNDLESQIRAAAERTMRTLENEARLAGARVDSLTAAIEGQRKSVSESNEAEVQLRALEREAKTQRDQLEQYMTRYRDAVARDAQNSTPADARIISRAIEPVTPSFPKKLPTILVATLATLFLSLAIVASRALLLGRAVPSDEYPQPRARRAAGPVDPDAPAGGGLHDDKAAHESEALMEDEAEEHLAPAGRSRVRERVAGLLAHNGRALQMDFHPDEADAFREGLVDWLGERRHDRAPCLLAVDAAGARGLTARDIARELAAGERAILIDLTDASPIYAAGLSELVSGEATFRDVIDREPKSRLHVITAGHAGADPVLAAPELVGLSLQALAETYDRVILAVSATQDAALLADLASKTDGALVIGGNVGNGHAVEVAYRLADAGSSAVAIVSGQPRLRAGQASRRDPAMSDL